MSVQPEPVMVRYVIGPDRGDDWLTSMRLLRRSRLRTGATRWELYRDVDRRDVFVEQFRVASLRSICASTRAG